MGEDIKVRSLANGRMKISHLNNGSNHSGVAQNLQNRIAIFLRVMDGILPILDEVTEWHGSEKNQVTAITA